jgi:hypothetical protein
MEDLLVPMQKLILYFDSSETVSMTRKNVNSSTLPEISGSGNTQRKTSPKKFRDE